MACFFGHKWNGCTCTKCGEKRNEGHDFTILKNTSGEVYILAGECREKCTICGEERVIGEHTFVKSDASCVEACSRCGILLQQHNWNGCTCSDCGEQRDTDHQYDFEPLAKEKTCSVCGKTEEREADEITIDRVIQRLKTEGRPVDFNSTAYECAKNIQSSASLLTTLIDACKAAGASLPFDEIYDHDFDHVEGYLANNHRVVIGFFLLGSYQDNPLLKSVAEFSAKMDFAKLESMKEDPVLSFWLAQGLLGYESVAKDVPSDVSPEKAALLLRKMFELSYGEAMRK